MDRPCLWIAYILRVGWPCLWTLGSGFDPRLDQFTQQGLGARSRVTSLARLPSPSNQIIMCEMFMKHRKVAAAVPVGVLDLTTDVAYGFALPCHLDRRYHPARMARNAAVGRALHEREISIGMTRYAGGLSGHRRLMRVLIVGLKRPVARRMAVHAARTREYLRSFVEQRTRASAGLRNRAESRWRLQDVAGRRSHGKGSDFHIWEQWEAWAGMEEAERTRCRNTPPPSRRSGRRDRRLCPARAGEVSAGQPSLSGQCRGSRGTG